MHWTQQTDPLHNLFLSAVVAILPVAFIFWALIVRKMKGHLASLAATGITMVLAVAVYGMPLQLALLSTVHGMLYGLFPICWIFITVLFLFNLTVQSGQFEIIKYSMGAISSDRNLQALLIAFSFGAFLEGAAGFGAPVAVSAAMLVGLGFDALYAARICLIANTAPVAFGAIGIPITVISHISGLPEMTISQMVGRTLTILSMLLPFYLVVLMAGFRRSMEVLPAIAVSGISFAVLQWYTANYLGPDLPDIIASIGSILSLAVFLRFWKPKKTWDFENASPPLPPAEQRHYSSGTILRAWSPFLILTAFIIIWGLGPVKHLLDAVGSIQFRIPALDKAISDTSGHLIAHVYTFNFLSAAGTAILVTALFTVPLTGMRFQEAIKIFRATLKQLKLPILTVSTILGFAYIINDSGIVTTIALALSTTGFLYPIFAPVLGWLGVFITGSDTSSNALFGKLQYATATSIGVNPVVTVAANSTGGVVGKMISPQSIAIATASVGLIGKESSLFRFTLKHSLIMLAFISCMTFAQAYYLKWLVPAAPPQVQQTPEHNRHPRAAEGTLWQLPRPAGMDITHHDGYHHKTINNEQ